MSEILRPSASSIITANAWKAYGTSSPFANWHTAISDAVPNYLSGKTGTGIEAAVEVEANQVGVVDQTFGIELELAGGAEDGNNHSLEPPFGRLQLNLVLGYEHTVVSGAGTVTPLSVSTDVTLVGAPVGAPFSLVPSNQASETTVLLSNGFRINYRPEIDLREGDSAKTLQYLAEFTPDGNAWTSEDINGLRIQINTRFQLFPVFSDSEIGEPLRRLMENYIPDLEVTLYQADEEPVPTSPLVFSPPPAPPGTTSPPPLPPVVDVCTESPPPPPGSSSGGPSPPAVGQSPPPPPESPPVETACPEPEASIVVSLDREQVPIQAGGQSRAITSMIQLTEVPEGTYPIEYHARRCDSGTCVGTLQLEVKAISAASVNLPEIDDDPLPAAQVGVAYSHTLTATGGFTSPTSPPDSQEYTWQIFGGESGQTGLPSGLSLDELTGEISGTPSVDGDFPIQVHVTDQQGQRTSKQLQMAVFEFPPVKEVVDLRDEAEPESLSLSLPPALTTPIPDSTLQIVRPIADLKRTYWGPPALYIRLLGEFSPLDTLAISSSVRYNGERSEFIVQFQTPDPPGPYTQIRVKLTSLLNVPSELTTPKVVLVVQPYNSLKPLKGTAAKATIPLTTNVEIQELVWRGLWYHSEFENLALRVYPQASSDLSDEDAHSVEALIGDMQAEITSLPLPPIVVDASMLVGGIPVGGVQTTPQLTDAYKTYELLWTGRWNKTQTEDLSVCFEPRVTRNESNTPCPWFLLDAADIVAMEDPPPSPGGAGGPPVPEVSNLFTVTATPQEVVSLSAQEYALTITSNGYDGNAAVQLGFIGTNPGVVGTFSDAVLEISNGETVNVVLTITPTTAALHSLAQFAVVVSATNGAGSGSTSTLKYYYDDPPPGPKPPLPPSAEGSTEFFLNTVPEVQTIPTTGTTTFTLKALAPLGTTTVSYSAEVRDDPGDITVTVSPGFHLLPAGLEKTVVVRVSTLTTTEDTYAVDVVGLGADGYYNCVTGTLLVQGPPDEVPILAPPAPPSPPITTQTVVETLVPNSVIRSVGSPTGSYENVDNGVDSPSDDEFMIFTFGPPPLVGVVAVEFGMTDPIASATYTVVTLRARLALTRDVQDPTISLQPVIEGTPVGDPHLISREDGLNTEPQNFAFSWEGSWSLGQLRSLVVQASGYTAGGQNELVGINVYEIDALVAGELLKPLPQVSPFRLWPTEILATAGVAFVYSDSGSQYGYLDVDDDPDCPVDTDYATVSLGPSEYAEVTYKLSDVPVSCQWSVLQGRVRLQQLTGDPLTASVNMTLDIRDQILTDGAGQTVQPPVGEYQEISSLWTSSSGVYFTDTDLNGAELTVRITNLTSESISLQVSAVDLLCQGVPLFTEEAKLIPTALVGGAGWGDFGGTVSDIDEGLEWPALVNGEVPPGASTITYPAVLPDEENLGPEEEFEPPFDEDYQFITLTDEFRTGLVVWDISDVPGCVTGSPPPPPEGASPPPEQTLPSVCYYTAVQIRMRVGQNPQPPSPPVIDVPVPTPFNLVSGTESVIPAGTQDVPYTPAFGQADATVPDNDAAFIFQVEGGIPPYTWNTFLVSTAGEAIGGTPPGMTIIQDPDDSSRFLYSPKDDLDAYDTPTTTGIFSWGISAQDASGEGLTFTVFHTINPPPGPSPPPLPPGPPPPAAPPPPPPPESPPGPPPSPPVEAGLAVAFDAITRIESEEQDHDPPDTILPADPDQPLTFFEQGDVQYQPFTVWELLGEERTDLTWLAESLGSIGLLDSLNVAVYANTDEDPAPTEISALGTLSLVMKMQYVGSEVPETGTADISVTSELPFEAGATDRLYWQLGSSLQITTADPLTEGQLGVGYTKTLSAIGGSPPYTWAVLSGSLPPGLNLVSSGVITGTPVLLGDYNFQVAVVDSRGTTATKTFTLTIGVQVSPPPPESPPPPPPESPVSPPPPDSPPSPVSPPPEFQVIPTPGIGVQFQPLIYDEKTEQYFGLGAKMIDHFLVPRSTLESPPTFDTFEHTWYGTWTDEEIRSLRVAMNAFIQEDPSPGAENTLFISAVDVIVTKASLIQVGPWPASTPPEGRIQWLESRTLTSLTDTTNFGTGNRGQWSSASDIMIYGVEGTAQGAINSIVGTAHKGGINQALANDVVNRYEIYGWLDTDGNAIADEQDARSTGVAYLASGVGPTDLEFLVRNILALKDVKNKPKQALLIDDELIVIDTTVNVDYTTGKIFTPEGGPEIIRGANETQEATHTAGTPIFLVPFWEELYEVSVADSIEGDSNLTDPSTEVNALGYTELGVQEGAVGWDSPPGTDQGTPGELLQNGPLDLRPISGDHPIRWLLRLRVVDVFGLTTETDISDSARPDLFTSYGENAFFGDSGDESKGVPDKRVIYVRQAKPPEPPRFRNSQ